MKISNVKAKLTGKDLLSIINDFVKIEGLIIKDITISDVIEIEGNFKKGFNIDFSLKIEIVEYLDGKIIGKLYNLKIMKLGLFRIARSFLLKQLIKNFNEIGIIANKDKVIIDIEKVLVNVPFIDINLKEIFIKNKELCLDIEDINVSLKGDLKKERNIEVIEELDKESNEEIIEINKIKDKYSVGRKIIEDKLPEKSKKFKEYIFVLPDIISLIYRLLKDQRVPVKTKAILSSAIAYIVLPTDIIPNNIPFIGAIDELGVAFFALNNVVNEVPMNIIIENWEGKNDIIVVLKSGLEYLINFTGAKNVERLCEVVSELVLL